MKPSLRRAIILPKVKDPTRLGSFLSFLLLLLTTSLHSQERIRGKVLDAEDGTGIPFAHIIPLDKKTRGTRTDLDGRFSLQVPTSSQHLLVSSIGHRKDTIAIPRDQEMLRIHLEPRSIRKDPVDVRPGRNPAIPIIEKCIERREDHDPLNAEAFRYRSYNRSFYSDRPIAFDPSWERGEEAAEPSSDSAQQLAIPDSMHAFLMETVTERQYAKGAFDKLTVIGAEASGFQEPPFSGISSEFQDISFYQDQVRILGEAYRSPIGKGALNKYRYELKSETGMEDSSSYITFSPKEGREHRALEGVLVIDPESHAVLAVRASPALQGPNPVRIEQRYEEREGYWFPVRMNFELRIPAVDMVFNGRGYLRDFRVGPASLGTVERKDLSIEEAPGYEDRDTAFWRKNRPEPLEKKDSITYRVLDSLGREKDLDRWMDAMEKLPVGLLPLGPFDLRLQELYRYNGHEKNRIGIGLGTNDRLSPYFRIGGYGAYGTGDREFKYGMDLEFRPTGDREWRIAAYYRKELREPGRSFSPREERFFDRGELFGASGQRSLFIRRMLRTEERGVRFRTGRPRFLKIAAWGTVSDELLLYSPPYLDERPRDRKLRLQSTGLRFRFAFRERSVEQLGRKVTVGTPYPVLEGRISKGWKGGPFGGERSYMRWTLRLDHGFHLRGLGRGRAVLKAQGSFGEPPLSRLFHAPGTFSRDIPILVPGSFNTAGAYEFLQKRSLSFFFEQSLGRIVLHEEFSRPLFRFRHNFGIGDRRGYTDLGDAAPSTMEEGYYESGFLVEDLLRLETEFYAYGIGVGVMYRYGPYGSSRFADDMAYGIRSSLEF